MIDESLSLIDEKKYVPVELESSFELTLFLLSHVEPSLTQPNSFPSLFKILI